MNSVGVRRLAWLAGLYSATAGLQRLVGLVLFLWLASTLSVEQYAGFGLLYATQAGVTTFALAGVVEGVVGALREHATADARRPLYARAGWMFVYIALPIGLVAALLVPLVVREVAIPISSAALAAAAGVLLAYTSLEAQLVRLDEAHRESLLFSFVPPMAGFAGGLLAVRSSTTVEAFFLGTSLGVFVAVLALAPWRVALRPGGVSVTRAQWLAVAPFMVIALFGWLSGYGNNYLANLVLDATVIAQFTFLLTVGSILQLVATALNQVWSPRFYQITHSRPVSEVERLNRRFFRGMAVVLGIGGAFMVILYPRAIVFAGGRLDAYRDMSLELALVLAYYVISVPMWHAQNYFLAYGKGRDLMRVTLWSGVIGVALTLALMWTIGAIGLYVGLMAQIVSRAAGYVLFARREWKITVAWEGVLIGLALLATGYAASR